MWNPLSWVMEAAAIMAIALAHGGVNFRFYTLLYTFVEMLLALHAGGLVLHFDCGIGLKNKNEMTICFSSKLSKFFVESNI